MKVDMNYVKERVNNEKIALVDSREYQRYIGEFEPLTIEFIEKIIEKERPDSLLAGMGGQTALNLAVELHEVVTRKKASSRK